MRITGPQQDVSLPPSISTGLQNRDERAGLDRSSVRPVQVSLSEEAQDKLKQRAAGGEPKTEKSKRDGGEAVKPEGKELSADEQEQVRKLAARDAQVRAHEAAHAATAGALGGGASFDYEQGPDGKRYAVGGEVPVQVQSGSSPEETIRNAQTVRSAALAPADPSGQDHAVAAEAAALEAQAREELAAKSRGEVEGEDRGGGGAKASAEKPEPGAVLSKLETERKQAYGGRGHDHGDTGCGFCSKAASKYAA
ncbi:MAG: putative metalloprotease CJM1_0395 family protein [Deltaproteobacteria bacterium]|nr:putative metalloprotease CJM1_0395 family protein [Deltaproteobacteria bacterium]